MAYRNIEQGEYYHVFNRGVNKDNIFFDDIDWHRFLFTIFAFQSDETPENFYRHIDDFVEIGRITEKILDYKKINRRRYVDLVAFALMPNHFHLVLREHRPKGVANFMSRLQNSYTKYVNTKYEKNGHLFQGPYRSVHVKDDDQLLYLSAYVHKNPKELSGWKNKIVDYPWSSLQDYTRENRWNVLLKNDIITRMFDDSDGYLDYVSKCPAKEEELYI